MKVFDEQGWLTPLVYLSNNAISFFGVLLTTTGGVSWFFMLPMYLGEAGAGHPYLGILFYLVMPFLFFTGLAFIPLGVYRRFRKEKRRKTYPAELPPVDWKNRQFRGLLVFVGATTLANMIIGGHYTFAAVEYMGSTTFCGQACHSVMAPEFAAYQDPPHFRVKCVDCHIGSGASWFVRSKLSGAGQVFAVLFDTFPRPIPAPVSDLRPARETCETCHWSAQFSGYRLRIWDKFAADEENTPSKTALLMKIGGGNAPTGIHGSHLAAGVRIEYASDPSRQTIPWVRYTDAAGQSTEYVTEEWKPGQEAGHERRIMDCIDCHNRPTHSFESAERAVDSALADGRIDPTLPFVKQQGLEILGVDYPSKADAQTAIPAALEEFYRTRHPQILAGRSEAVRQAGQGLLSIYQRNIFPEMNVTWGTYHDNIGHTEFPGCFRCHDDLHTSTDGEKVITQDCGSCHELLALEKSDPEILTALGVTQ